MLEWMYANAYISDMRATSSSEFRKNLAAMLDQVAADHEPLLITREGGRPAAVLLSLEDFAGYEETRHLLRPPGNAARLLQAIGELDAGQGTERSLAG